MRTYSIKPLLKIILTLFIFSVISFAFFGESFTPWFSGENEGTNLFVRPLWQALPLFTLLFLGDLLLPLPGTAIQTFIGQHYGPWVGTALAMGAVTFAGLFGYLGCRFLGRRFPRLLGNPEEAEAYHELFTRWGGWLIILSRFTPILPEIVLMLAGFTKMPLRQFLPALLTSAFFSSLCFCLLGDWLSNKPVTALLISLFLPVLCWGVIQPILRKAQT